MCSTHPRIIKRAVGEFEALIPKTTLEVADEDYRILKATKRRTADEVHQFEECPAAERFLKILESPTPAKKAAEIQRHLEWISKELRR